MNDVTDADIKQAQAEIERIERDLKTLTDGPPAERDALSLEIYRKHFNALPNLMFELIQYRSISPSPEQLVNGLKFYDLCFSRAGFYIEYLEKLLDVNKIMYDKNVLEAVEPSVNVPADKSKIN
jgi:hypothetical protein